VRVVPVSEKFNAYGETVLRTLKDAGLRAAADLRNEKLGAKIRAGELEKVPALLIVGEKEAAAGTVSLRARHGREEKDLKLEILIDRTRLAVASRALAWHETSTARRQ
jgi:threonyl-tRNA synthetase